MVNELVDNYYAIYYKSLREFRIMTGIISFTVLCNVVPIRMFMQETIIIQRFYKHREEHF